jgi:hypothetical protein
MDNSTLEDKAFALGLQELARRYPEDLHKALDNAKALADRLPQNIHWTEEPAHTFNLAPRSDVRS